MLEDISRGEVLFAAATRALKVRSLGWSFIVACCGCRWILYRTIAITHITSPPTPTPPPQKKTQIMRDFTASQSAHLQRGGLPLEMLAALLNNNVEAYAQSLEFTEHVQVGVCFGGVGVRGAGEKG